MSNILEIHEDTQVEFGVTATIQRTFEGVQLPNDYGAFFLDEKTADVKFDVNDVMIAAHKCILAFRNKKFYDLLFNDNENRRIVKINDKDFVITADGFKAFLRIFYMSVVHVTSDNVCEVYMLAHKFNVPQWKELCAAFLEKTLTFKTVFAAYDLAVKFKRSQLRRSCEEAIALNMNMDKFVGSEVLSECSYETLKIILKRPTHRADPVAEVKACIKWAENKCRQNKIDPDDLKNCRKQLCDCFSLLRFSKMSSEQFLVCLRDYYEFFTTEEIKSIIGEILCFGKQK